jgi:hypothetical protein
LFALPRREGLQLCLLTGNARAGQVLRAAHRLLFECAGRIDDVALRRSYLENVPAHREIEDAFSTP